MVINIKKINTLFKVLIIWFLLIPIFVLANGDHEHETEEGRKLVESKVSCDELTDEQLEAIGEYYMEQMHPGEAHEMMDKMMGGEGSESLKQVHINMARRLYCNDNIYVGYGMMGAGGMMGGGMMNNMMQGMMGNYPIGYGFGYWGFWNIIWTLFWIGLIVLVIWLIYKLIIKREGISKSPIEILKKRYANGEITKKQFEQMKKDIEE